VKQPHTGEAPTVQINLVYQNKKSGVTFGTCPIQNALLSTDSMKLLAEFMKSVEKDFGRVVFEGKGRIYEPDAKLAETNTGLVNSGIGGRK
jgi:hypothetical protein